MNQNNQVAVVEQPISTPIFYNSTKKGIVNKVVGQRYEFGMGTISAWRKSLRESGQSANEASQTISMALASGQGNLRWAQMQVGIEAARTQGLVPSIMDLRNKTGVLRFESKPSAKMGKTSRIIEQANAAINDRDAKILALEAKLAKFEAMIVRAAA